MMLHLVRHPPVAKAWQKRCYGQSDPGLSREGQKMVAPLVDQLVALKPDIILHSDMVRTRAIATLFADRLGLVSSAESLWRERDFGAWEGATWNAIYRATGNAMDGMIDAPDRFRPGGGETTAELMRRVQKAMDILPKADCIVIVTHGGPIACAIATRTGATLQQLASLVPNTGSVTTL